uniref:acetate--CoA ligase family protein n=1 Tax=Halomonas sp. TaxID=1486246 RepID=UPI0035621D3A
MNDSLNIIIAARKAGRGSLTEAEGKRLLEGFGVRAPRSVQVKGVEDVASGLRDLKAPHVVKVVSQDILHKSDAGGVALNLQDADDVVDAIQ